MIDIVWLKRDLRLTDHAPLLHAGLASKNLALIYIFEPMLIDDPHYDIRHWRFVWQSLEDIKNQLENHNGKLNIFFGEALEVFKTLHHDYEINSIFSHEEIGIKKTFERDQAIANWTILNQIQWHEFQHGAVIRNSKNRKNWDKKWQSVMRAPIQTIALEKFLWREIPLKCKFKVPKRLISNWEKENNDFQLGGAKKAWETLNDFHHERGIDYYWNISSPLNSQKYCSRLSPYLSWGNISLRETYQALLNNWNKKGWRRSLIALSSRLHWHCHFIQKFDNEHRMEWEPINRGYLSFPYRDSSSIEQKRYLAAWEEGKTGYPIIDASIRCLIATGYINFRSRAMLVSFLCHHLMIDWRLGVKKLARLFLDFEPGIHYSQFQMQAGVVGTHIIRIYNPIKQAKEKDPSAEFIYRWLPELRPLPIELAHEPWLITDLEQQMFGFSIGTDYPEPIVDIKQTGGEARDILWKYRQNPSSKKESQRILRKHVRPK